MPRTDPTAGPSKAPEADAGDTLFELVAERAPERLRSGSFVVGRIVAVESEASARVALGEAADEAAARARTVVALDPADAGRDAIVVCDDGDPERPIILGLLQDDAPARRTEARVDGKRVCLEGTEEVELRCGKASITLTREGKIRIRGADVLSRSSGGQRIKGASVQIN